MGQVIVCHEKHGEWYYDATTPEKFAESALKILTNRWKDGYWYYDPDELDKESLNSQYGGRDRMIETLLPEGHWPGWDASEDLRVAAIKNYQDVLKDRYGDDPEVLELKTKKLNAAIKEYKWRREYRKWYALAKRIVEEQSTEIHTWIDSKGEPGTGNEPVAWVLLEDRSDHEYERVELEDLQ